MRLIIACPLALFAAALGTSISAPAALANPAAVAPAGWERSESRGLIVYRSPSGREVMVFRVVAGVTDPAAALADLATTMTNGADQITVSSPSSAGSLAVHDVEYSKRGAAMRGKVIGVRQSNGEFLTVSHLAPKAEPGLSARMTASVQKMAALSGGSGSASTATAAGSPAQSRPATTPVSAPKGRGPAVASVLFELSYKYGVGGAAYPNYELVALMKNGSAAKLGGYALDSVDLAAIRRQKSANVGTWQRAGANYRVRWGDGDTSDLKPTVGPPRALPGKSQLVGSYQAIGGGGNVALGGGTITAQVKQFNFRSDGTFSHSSKKTASSGAGVGRASSGTSGRWGLSGPNLTLQYGNGRVVRTTVFYSGSRKSSANFGRYGVLWIGGEDYKRVR